MEPVKVEFFMQDSLTPGLEKAGQSAETLGKKAEQVSKDITDRITAQKEQIKYVESCLKDLKKQYDNLAPGKGQLEMKAEIDACTKALQEDKNILSSLEAEHDKASASTKRLSMQLREMQNAMALMRLEGKENTKEYADMAQKAATLSDTIGDLRAQTNILAHDNAGLQGAIAGVNGLSGMFTVATGAMGVFASENENLAKIQTRVQSVMAVTMGLQQVMNTLNKDSAFRLVTVVKMKNLLTAANTRLATSLGVSNAAATALMATLTLGLSAVITGLIVLWNKYSDAQAEAAQKAKERVEIESAGRAGMVKTRFELENMIKSLKDFTGSKEQEKAKVEELNSKYGESFGYYNTVAEWYDILIQKSEAYIQMLFLQAKAQSLVNKAVEADEKVNDVKATNPEDVEGSMGWLSRVGLFMNQSRNPMFDAQAAFEKHNTAAKNAAIKAAEDQRETYLNEAKKLQEEIAELGKKAGIGGFVPPKKDETKTAGNLTELELKARKKIEDNTVALMKEGYERRRKEAELAFAREKERITEEEKQRLELYEKLRKAGQPVTKAQKDAISTQANEQNRQAKDLYEQALAGINAKEKLELGKQEKVIKEALTKYQTYYQKRLAVIAQYQKDRENLEKGGATEGQYAELDYQHEKALSEIDQAFAMREDSFKVWADSIVNLSLEQLRKLLYQAQQELQRMEFLNPTGDLSSYRQRIVELEKVIVDFNKKNDKTPA
jgi:hypothetical protein